MIKEFLDSGAVFSECGKHRLLLWRDWDWQKPRMLLVMLNPSTADAEALDATMRSVLDLAVLSGFGSVQVVNLFSVIESDSRRLGEHHPLVHADADGYVQRQLGCLDGNGAVVCGWGRASGAGADVRELLTRRVREFRAMFERYDVRPRCFARNKDGSPGHPLYLSRMSPLEPWA